MKKTTKRNYCLRCEFETNHNLLFKEMINGDNEDYLYQIKYMVVQCAGCNKISFREEFIDIESAYQDEYNNWTPDITIDTYPNKINIKSNIENVYSLPKKIKIVYNESIKAFNNNCYLLTGVGFRAVIEAICIDKKVAGRNLEKKINNLIKQKLITEKEANRLHSIRFLGNDSVHDMSVPKKEKLMLVLYIIEHLLNNLYLIDYKSQDHLETIISNYSEFIELIGWRIQAFKKGDEIPIKMILGKNIRRLNGKLNEFETELKKNIKSKKYKELSIGKFDKFAESPKDLQHYIIN